VKFPIAIFILMAGASQALAQEWVLGLGYADFSNSNSNDQGLIAFEVHAEPFYENGPFEVSLAGAVVAHSTGDVFAGVGLSGLLALEGRWFIEGSVMPGYYRASTPQNGLGSDFEIRSLLGVGYTLNSGDRLSLAVTHKSNASTSAVNPGVNSIELRLRRKF
jgi:lipid A 3-O-deacylase